MGLMDKVKAGAEQAAGKVKAGAEQAATKARDEMEELQTKRELNQLYVDIGKKTVELVDGGAVSNPELTGLVQRAHALKAQLETEQPAGS